MFMSKEHADSLKPVLQWVSGEAPRLRERVLARSLLAKMRGIETWKQLGLTKREMELYKVVTLAFPEGAIPEGTQLKFEGLESSIVRERYLGEPLGLGKAPLEITKARYSQAKCVSCKVFTNMRTEKGAPACSEHGGKP